MEDLLYPDTGKRKRSPAGSLVDVPIPFFSQYHPADLNPDQDVSLSYGQHPLKRLRLPAKPPAPEVGTSASLLCLPPGILQAIFSHLDPPSLARLTGTNRLFRSLLDPRYSLPADHASQRQYKGRTFKTHVYSVRSQDAVWTTSRRAHVPSMPRPIGGLSERDFFALAYGTTCQICGTRPPAFRTHKDPWKPSHRELTVYTIWSFKIRSCTHCLAPKLRKDSDVFISDASPLRPGLSFAFFTQSLHFVPQSLCQGPVPADIVLHKYHYAPEIEALEKEAKNVQELGSGALEEWFKGLSSRGQDAQKFAAQLEGWMSDGGLDNGYRALFPDRGASGLSQRESPALSPGHYYPVPSSKSFDALRFSLPVPNALPVMPLRAYGTAPGLEELPGMPSKLSDASSIGSQKSNRKYAAAPSSREIARNRAYKKEDIIARCRTLNPPISKNMLDRLDAFENALKVPMPLNDNSWEALKDMLMRQRRQVELRDEARNAVRTAPTPGQFTAPSRTDEYILAHADVPLKDKLSEIAEEYIKQRFGHGGWITYLTAPQFAAEVLIHVRQTYVNEKARIDGLRAQSGFLSLSAPQDEMLKYEHMKWVFDQTIRPRTEQTRKDLFICAACPSGGAVKYFAFESLIQHFAFKHDPNVTTEAPKAFWKCEWPEVPPFNAHPERVRTPTPSVTHTPTLSHKPLSVMSPGSIVQVTAPSGRRTPDTMSLLSGNTNPFSASGHITRQQNPMQSAPGPAMYELQRNSLSSEISRSWKILQATPYMPVNLQLHIALGLAIWNFSKRYRNEPPLNLLKDCILTRLELRELRDTEHLMCAQCCINGDERAGTQWSFQDLVVHFEKAHLENGPPGIRLDWKNDMISLPEPALIKGLLSNAEMPTMLLDLLKQAEITATIEMSTTPARLPNHQPYSPFSSVRHSQDDVHNPPPFMSMDGETNYQSHPYSEAQYVPSRRLIRSTAATYGDLNSSRDVWSETSRTIKSEDMSSIGSKRPILTARELHMPNTPASTRPDKPLPSVEATPVFTDRHVEVSRGEVMSRSETIRSHRSRGEKVSGNTAEDFLSTIEDRLDIEMADSESSERRSTRTSRPISRTNSVRDPSTRISRRSSPDPLDGDSRRLSNGNTYNIQRQAPEMHIQRHDHPAHPHTSGESSMVQMERQPSRIIEFDRQGNPVPSAGQVYQEVSPPRRASNRRYVDSYGRTIDPSSPAYARTFVPATHEIASTQYMDERYSRTLYEPIGYSASTGYRPDRIVDPVTGQTYIAERPPVRQLIEIDEHYGRPQMIYDETGRPVMFEYRQPDPNTYRVEDGRYDRFPAEYHDRRYQGR